MTTSPPGAATDSGGSFDLMFASGFVVVDAVEKGTADTFLVPGVEEAEQLHSLMESL